MVTAVMVMVVVVVQAGRRSWGIKSFIVRENGVSYLAAHQVAVNVSAAGAQGIAVSI